MQVIINVSREFQGVTMVFSTTANSVEEAIKVANQLTEMKAADLPAASTDATIIEKHTGAQTDGIEGSSVKTTQPDAEIETAVAEVEKKAKAEKKPAVKTASAQPPVEQPLTQTDGAGKPSEEKAARAYEEVRSKILQMSKDLGREPTVAALARFGVKAGAELKPEQYNEAYDYFVRVIAKEIDPTKSEADAEEFA